MISTTGNLLGIGFKFIDLQSQVVKNRVCQNSWFLGTFWEKMVPHGQTVHFRPHSVRSVRILVTRWDRLVTLTWFLVLYWDSSLVLCWWNTKTMAAILELRPTCYATTTLDSVVHSRQVQKSFHLSHQRAKVKKRRTRIFFLPSARFPV